MSPGSPGPAPQGGGWSTPEQLQVEQPQRGFLPSFFLLPSFLLPSRPFQVCDNIFIYTCLLLWFSYALSQKGSYRSHIFKHTHFIQSNILHLIFSYTQCSELCSFYQLHLSLVIPYSTLLTSSLTHLHMHVPHCDASPPCRETLRSVLGCLSTLPCSSSVSWDQPHHPSELNPDILNWLCS